MQRVNSAKNNANSGIKLLDGGGGGVEPFHCIRPFPTALFPSKEGFVVNPHRRPSGNSHIPAIEILKLTSSSPLTLRTVLIVEVKNTDEWPTGIPALERQLTTQTDAAFVGTDAAFIGAAHAEVYWIGAMGPHWRYGKKDQDDGQDLVPLIEWHHTQVHDAASFADLQKLVALVNAL